MKRRRNGALVYDLGTRTWREADPPVELSRRETAIGWICCIVAAGLVAGAIWGWLQ
jgi:hypothetical protein